MVHSRLGQFLVFAGVYAVSLLISEGLNRVWNRSMWRDWAIFCICLAIGIFGFLPG